MYLITVIPGKGSYGDEIGSYYQLGIMRVINLSSDLSFPDTRDIKGLFDQDALRTAK
jgi:hypothetical protein